jgi:hypothetical protein
VSSCVNVIYNNVVQFTCIGPTNISDCININVVHNNIMQISFFKYIMRIHLLMNLGRFLISF